MEIAPTATTNCLVAMPLWRYPAVAI